MTKSLIIGGGAAGVTAAKALRGQNPTVDITLVEPKKYFEVTMFAFCTPFNEEDRKNALHPLQPWADKHNIRLIHSIVTNLTAEQATLSNGEKVEFDVCMVGTGAGCHWTACVRGPTAPATLEERAARLERKASVL